jgi:hypothetical protein
MKEQWNPATLNEAVGAYEVEEQNRIVGEMVKDGVPEIVVLFDALATLGSWDKKMQKIRSNGNGHKT